MRLFGNVTTAANVITDFDFENPQPPSAFAEPRARRNAMADAIRLRLQTSCPALEVNDLLMGGHTATD